MEKAIFFDTETFNKALMGHKSEMDKLYNSPNLGFDFKDKISKLHDVLEERFPGQLHVITGEQPYGAYGRPKVLAKRLLSKALQFHNPEIKVIELFASNDLIGSEEGFWRLTLPTKTAGPDGVVSQNVLSDKFRANGKTARGLLLPHEYVTGQVQKIIQNTRHHYPGNLPYNKGSRYDLSVITEWAHSYGITIDSNNPAPHAPENYADAHINWLVALEKKLGLETDYVTEEGEIDLMLARQGGVEVIQSLWKTGLSSMMERSIPTISLKLTPEEIARTPFNLAREGNRLVTRFHPEDDSLIEAITKDGIETLTLDQALSGDFEFSWKAVPRVVLYSLSGLDGHVTGGGSVYNADAQLFMDINNLPYFPIIYMNPQINGETVSVLQYQTVSSGRNFDMAKEQVRKGKVSLLDFVMSCDTEEARAKIEETILTHQPFNTTEYVEILSKDQI